MRRPLALVASEACAASAPATDAQQVFEHWLFMLSKDRNRVAFGPSRRKSVQKALALYQIDTLMAAIEGCAASSWHAGDNDRNRTYQDLELILRDEEHIERFAESGYALRDQVAGELRAQAAPPTIEPPSDPAVIAAHRERMRELASTLRRRAR